MNLQEQINIASAGATISIPDGERCIGNFVIDKPVTIVGGAGSMIIAPRAHSGTEWAMPAFEIKPMTGPVALRKLAITVADDVKNFWDLIRYGGADAASGQTSLDKVPKGLWIDECDIYGRADVGSQRGISANGSNFKITKSKVREIHGKGFDTQAICSWNGPGPFLIEDCYLEGAGENVMFGGSPPIIPNLIHSDIIFRRNVCFKPLSWRGVWTVKNLFELKNSRNVLIEGNVFENNWTDAQAGRAIVFTPRPSDSGSWALIEDVVFQHNVIKNVGSGILLLGADQPPAPTETRLRRVKVLNNLWLIDGPKFGSNGFFATVINKTEDVAIEHNTVIQTGNIIGSDYAPNSGFIYRDNISRHNEYGIFGGGIGNAAITQYFPGAVVTGNLFAKEVNAPGNVEFIYPAGNYFPATLNDVGFVDMAGGDYRLASTSPYRGKGVNGSDPGCDVNALNAAIGGTVVTPLPTPTEPTPVPAPTPTQPTPAPSTESPNGTKATTIVDSQGAVWTIGAQKQTLRNGTQAGGGWGDTYKYVNKEVYTWGDVNQEDPAKRNWYKWSGSWSSVGPTEPGGVTTPEPTPTPVPQPAPTPAPAPAPAPVVEEYKIESFSGTEASRTALSQRMWATGFGYWSETDSDCKGNKIKFRRFK